MGKTFLIARREYLAFVRTVGFWLSLLTVPAIFGFAVGLPLLMHRSEPVQTVAVLDLTGEHVGASISDILRKHQPHSGAFSGGGIREVALPGGLSPALSLKDAEAKIPALVDAGAVTAIVVAYDDGSKLHFHLWSNSNHRGDLKDAIGDDLDSLQYDKLARLRGIDPQVARELHETRADIRNLTPASAGNEKQGFAQALRENGGRFMGIAVSYVTWIAIFSSAMILLGSVIEEKSSKMLEVLLASASTESILLGKVLGVAGVMLTVAAIWATVVAGLGHFGFAALPPDVAVALKAALLGLFSPVHIALLLAYLIGGYLMFGLFFAAVGAFCETQKDAQAVIGPTTIVLMIPMMTFQIAIRSADVPMIQYMSWFPLFTPFLMPLRLAQGVAWYEIAGTLAGMGAVALFMINLGRRAFRQGALTGEKLSWGALFGTGRRDV